MDVKRKDTEPGEVAAGDKPSHHLERGFRNNHEHHQHGFGDFVRWQRESGGKRGPLIQFPIAGNDPGELKANRTAHTLTWIGHSTFLWQYKGTNVLTDPHMTERASPVFFAGPRRGTPPGLSMDELPDLDVVLVSHNHYDHLDYATVKGILARNGTEPLFCVPLGVKKWFADLGVGNVLELDWWQSRTVGDWTHHCVPVQHFSGRSLTDRNATLWCGWIMEHRDGYKLFFAGDTGYSPDFKDIGERFAPVDLSLLPIGAYDPRWFMSSMHVNPDEAVRIHQDVGSRLSIAMHWGTFSLTDEPMDEPPRLLKEALREHAVPEENFIVMEHGETRRF